MSQLSENPFKWDFDNKYENVPVIEIFFNSDLIRTFVNLLENFVLLRDGFWGKLSFLAEHIDP